jgi:hypothetical protein
LSAAVFEKRLGLDARRDSKRFLEPTLDSPCGRQLLDSSIPAPSPKYLVKVLLDVAILRSLNIDLDTLCLGIKLGTFDEDVLQILVPAENCFGRAIKPLL